MGVQEYVAKDLELENGVRQVNENSSECLNTCTNSMSCHSITYCQSARGFSVCYNHEKNVSVDVERFDLTKVQCMDGFCAEFSKCTTLKKICPRGLFKSVNYNLRGTLMLFIITTNICFLLS